jgi:hypothetical protein
MKRVPLKKLRRGSQEYKVHPETWSNALLLASDHGWRPSCPAYFFLGSGVDVSEADVAELVRVWDHLIDNAPSLLIRRKIDKGGGDIQLITMELGVLAEIRNFCFGGPFRIEG